MYAGLFAGTKWPLWRDGRCSEVEIRVNVWTNKSGRPREVAVSGG